MWVISTWVCESYLSVLIVNFSKLCSKEPGRALAAGGKELCYLTHLGNGISWAFLCLPPVFVACWYHHHESCFTPRNI